MKLTIAIPALNEEDSIISIIERTLAAREYIIANSPVTELDIAVISDGSTDRTVERASNFHDKIRLIVFPKNRGYGAAIKEAWRESDAELVGFLDADGTCEPRFFANLCSALAKENLDVVLGCRLNKDSKMPVVRLVGNTMFATLLSLLANSNVRDTASGMRVVRRPSLRHIFPLPDGLHFTPAMSARAMMSGVLRIGEVNMPYNERVGESKLHVIKDGIRFLRVIMEAAFLYRPSRPLALFGMFCATLAAAIMASPILYYVQNKSVQEWMIYRFLVGNLLGTAAVLSWCTAYLAKQMTRVAIEQEVGDQRSLVDSLFNGASSWILPICLVGFGSMLVAGSFFEWWITGHTLEHWSRFIVMTFCFTTTITILLTKGVDQVLSLLRDRVHYWREIDMQDPSPGTLAQLANKVKSWPTVETSPEVKHR